MRPLRPRSDRIAGSSIAMSRPRGYFGVGRDRMSLDGISPLPGSRRAYPGSPYPGCESMKKNKGA